MSQHSFLEPNDELDNDASSSNEDEVEDEVQDIYEGIFGLVTNDIHVIQRLIGCVRKVIARPDVSAHQIHELAKLLFGLEMLPEPTPGLDITLSVGRRYDNGESGYHELELSGKSFRLEEQSYIILDLSAGGDSMAVTIFEAEVGGFRAFDNPFGLGGWLDDFEEACGEMDKQIKVINYSEEEIDWSAEPDPDLWDRLDFKGGWSL